MNCAVRVAVHVVGILNSLLSKINLLCKQKSSRISTYKVNPEEADRSKKGNLSFSHIIVCSPRFTNDSSLRALQGKDVSCPMPGPDALVLPLEIHSYFPNIILTLLVCVCIVQSEIRNQEYSSGLFPGP